MPLFPPIRAGAYTLSITTRPDTPTWQVTTWAVTDGDEMPAGHEGFDDLPSALEYLQYIGESQSDGSEISSTLGNIQHMIQAVRRSGADPSVGWPMRAREQNPGFVFDPKTDLLYASPKRPVSGLRVPHMIGLANVRTSTGGLAGLFVTSKPIPLKNVEALELAPLGRHAVKAMYVEIADRLFPEWPRTFAGRSANRMRRPSDQANAKVSLRV